MNIFNHPGCTTVLGRPANMTEEQCSGLPVVAHTDEMGVSAVSFWKPTEEELAILNAGGTVALGVLGGMTGHPIVWVSAGHPVEEAQYVGAPAAEEEKPFKLELVQP